MSLLINNDLIWISVPKCASISIEHALINADLDIKLLSEYRYSHRTDLVHGHYRKSQLFDEFGIKETIRRNLGMGKISKLNIEYTPVGEKIIISTSRPGLVIGRRGEKIEELTDLLKKKFSFLISVL